jgi:hypothetical protein
VSVAAQQQPGSGYGDNLKTLARDDDDMDQRTPLLTSDRNSEIILVDYDADDPENPMTWSSNRKWMIVLAISWMGFVR